MWDAQAKKWVFSQNMGCNVSHKPTDRRYVPVIIAALLIVVQTLVYFEYQSLCVHELMRRKWRQAHSVAAGANPNPLRTS
jgi:hypothetical protein